MFNEPLIDPTAGERARRLKLHPEVPQPVLDPTDPRYGLPSTAAQPRDAEDITPREPAGRGRSRRI